jgi:preprotein translocase subunit SecD
MTIHQKNKKQYLIICAFSVLAALFTTALSAAGLSGDQPRKIKFELRLASYEKVDGWKSVPGPYPAKTDIWISPEAALTNADLARAWPQPDGDAFSVGFLLTEEGALKLARLTKSHVGEFVAVMLDGRVVSAPKIMAEITGGRAFIQGKLNGEEARSIAEGIMVK